jgi:uncharacterized protein (TIGR03083 family)
MVNPDDLRRASAVAFDALVPRVGDDWNRPAGTLEWSCRTTLDHVVDALVFYSTQLAARAEERVPSVRAGDPTSSVERLLGSVTSGAAVLAEVASAAGPGVRAYHRSGMADAEGFLAMGCDEILVHASDIAEGLGTGFEPPEELCATVLARLFPWAPHDRGAWETLLWANGRSALGDIAQLGPDWSWHCAPLDEWDGSSPIRSRSP